MYIRMQISIGIPVMASYASKRNTGAFLVVNYKMIRFLQFADEHSTGIKFFAIKQKSLGSL